MPEIVVSAQSRTETGKNVNRRLRVQGMIPAVVYGAGVAPRAISVSPKELAAILRSGHGENTLLDLDLAGAKSKVILKDYQVDPIKGRLLHVDLYEVALDKPLRLEVHVELHGTPVGVKTHGGSLEFVNRTIMVECLPADIPEKIELDITDLEIGKHIRVHDLPLPKNVKAVADPELVIVHVVAPRTEAATTEGAAAAEPEVIKAKGKPEDAKGDAKAPAGKAAAKPAEKKPAEKKK